MHVKINERMDGQIGWILILSTWNYLDFEKYLGLNGAENGRLYKLGLQQFVKVVDF